MSLKNTVNNILDRFKKPKGPPDKSRAIKFLKEYLALPIFSNKKGIKKRVAMLKKHNVEYYKIKKNSKGERVYHVNDIIINASELE